MCHPNPSATGHPERTPSEQETGVATCFADQARRLAGQHIVVRRGGNLGWLETRMRHLVGTLNAAHHHFAQVAQEQRASSYAAEWLLDNFYLVQQALREIPKDLPASYYHQLPKLSHPLPQETPRVYAIAQEILHLSSVQIAPASMQQFIGEYQDVAPLSMGELWALPTMLRLCVLTYMAEAVARIAPLEDTMASALAVEPPVTIADDEIVANAIVTLRTLDNTDWVAFVESTSLVERTLSMDPAGEYPHMDTGTRNRYRGVVESIARATERDEAAVAVEAIALAAAADVAKPSSAPANHVGYYLFSEGRNALERQLNYRPHGYVRICRWLHGHATLVYISSIGLLTLFVIAVLLAYAQHSSPSLLQLGVVAVLTLLPAISLAVGLINWGVAYVVPTSILPKLDFNDGIPEEYCTMVVVPALLATTNDVEFLLQQVERHYLANPDSHLAFALLTDFVDAPQQQIPSDEELLRQVEDGIRRLNQKYTRPTGTPFYLFHRRRLWNPGEGVWMGWERKRGKLVEFNRLILNRGETSYVVQIGDAAFLQMIRYVITLDADTSLPRDSAHRLIGTLAHPLNRAQIHPDACTVTAGYTMLQPRVEITPNSAIQTRFSRIFSDTTGIDLYDSTVSNIYQDLFGEGLFLGKGIYDLSAFEQCMADVVPENALLSHDLFEGIHGRVGVATDIVLFEEYPPNYLADARRQHRWIRGDWQLLPWLLPFMFRNQRGREIRQLSAIDRWKILDNLRRSLLQIGVLALLIASWLGGLPGSPAVWSLFVVITLGIHTLTAVLTDSLRRSSPSEAIRTGKPRFLRWLLVVVFLCHQALLALDAIVRTLTRLLITHRHLLQWTTSTHINRLFERKHRWIWSWWQMLGAPIVALGLGALVAFANPAALPFALPWLAGWFFSPQVAHWSSRPPPIPATVLTAAQTQQLRLLARRTWLYFETFMVPGDHWLPPDHFQAIPHGLVAHRTSPTNIGLALLSTLAAYDLGYVGINEVIIRLLETLDNLRPLERHRGHFLNWYDTQTQAPLPPRYVSTVDSGNLAASLLVLARGCDDLMQAQIVRQQSLEGLLDTLSSLDEVIEHFGRSNPAAVVPFRTQVKRLSEEILASRGHPERWTALLVRLSTQESPALDQQLSALLDAQSLSQDPEVLRSLRTWLQRYHHHLSTVSTEMEQLIGWRRLLHEPAPLLIAKSGSALHEEWRSLVELLAPMPQLHEIPSLARTAQDKCTRLQTLVGAYIDTEHKEQSVQARAWCTALNEALSTALIHAEHLLDLCRHVKTDAENYLQGMEFGFLYDTRRHVFHIGYNVERETLDANHYDLLASEARIASVIAIAKGEVPQRHWLHLGRPLTPMNGGRVLLSWSGTMFEYLMPNLLMQQHEGTLLDQSNRTAVLQQISYAGEQKVPWGVSESGYYLFDAAGSYQYRAFGVPGLGFKRGLGEDLVISPYASLLALPMQPQAVIQNLARFRDLGMQGEYGLYEAIDFTPGRLPPNQSHAIVRSFMAHHQGMIMLALANKLCADSMVRRFHTDPRVQSTELLLQERLPTEAPVELASADYVVGTVLPHPEKASRTQPWPAPVNTPSPQAYFLSNGRFGTLLTNSGGGYSSWQGTVQRPNRIDLTRWRADTTLDDWGVWLYVQEAPPQDETCPILWSLGGQPVDTGAENRQVFFAPHQADLLCRRDNLSLHMQLTIAPEDDVEIRRLSITNGCDRPRRLRLFSYGEVVLAQQESDRRHPAFNKLFIESEYLSDLNALLFWRRLRSPAEIPVYMLHSLIAEPGCTVTGDYETDRSRFLGRGGTAHRPHALAPGGHGLTQTVGATLDPIFSIGQSIELEPHTTAQVAFLTMAADSRQAVLSLAQRYQEWARLDRVFDQARLASEREMHQLELTTQDLERTQQLLSALLYPSATLRSDPERIAANRSGQAGLWPFGLSGDYPILLVHYDGAEHLALLQEVLLSHAYWRRRGLLIDLVLLNGQDSNYAQELQEATRRLLRQTNAEPWLGRRGGIFHLYADQIDEAARVLLETAARVVLHGDDGKLAQQIKDIGTLPLRLPAFVPPHLHNDIVEKTPPLERPTDLKFDNGWGGFSCDGREYIIYLRPGRPTPAPWLNVIANPQFGFLTSEMGSGYSWAINSGENRLTPWHNDPVTDRTGEAIYLRDEETGLLWSPTPLPASDDAPYLVRHGAGYSVFEHHSHGLIQHVRLFAAPDAPVKIAQVRLENCWERVRRITITHYAEWVLGVHRDAMQAYVIPIYDKDRNALLALNPYNVEFGERVAWVAASKKLHGLTTDRTEFLGRLGSLAKPAALGRIGLTGTVLAGLDPCAALQLHVDLQPGAVEEVYFLLGQGNDLNEAQHLIDRYLDPTEVAAAWSGVTAFWSDLLGTVSVETPDPAMDLLLNRWLLYQDLSCRIWARSALYQSSGAFGFRDQLQDVLAVLNAAPQIAREHIVSAAHCQFQEGDVLHWWHPPSGRGVRTNISDDLLWLPFATAAYVTTTGDVSILWEETPFLIGEPLRPEEEDRYGQYAQTAEHHAIFEHCRRALTRSWGRRSKRGIPLISGGDWNDGMNRVGIEGKGESIWLGWFLYRCLIDFAQICDIIEQPDMANDYRRQADELKTALATHAWDGDWYLRATYDDGSPLGSQRNRECRIDSIAQSWAILSHGGDAKQARHALDAVLEHLVQPDMLLLFTPPFDRTLRHPGYIKGYPPGIRENGGQYTHAAIWAVWAFAECGEGDRAHALFQTLTPIHHADTQEKASRYCVEPYVVAADVYSMPPHTGRGGWTWYTGSAGWMYRLGMEAILGVRRVNSTLRFAPCIPRAWTGYNVTYREGNAVYRIHVENPNGVNRGVKQVMLDGVVMTDGEIQLGGAGEHEVLITLGQTE